MDGSATEDECPICMGTVQNPSEPSLCCRKVFCQACLRESTRERNHCPHCRTQLPSPDGLAFGPYGHQYLGPALLSEDPFSLQPAGILNRLRHANIHLAAVQRAQSTNIALANQQAAPVPAVQATPSSSVSRTQRLPGTHLFRAWRSRRATQVTPGFNPVVPVINAYAMNVQSAPAAPLASPPGSSFGPANPSPLIIQDALSEFDEMAWRTEIELMENAPTQLSGHAVRTFSCPYCLQDGLDDLDLRDHCNDNHLNDTRRVVCPVCVDLPHGDPLYQSRDFIGHLNLRHCYYIEDMTNIHQSDDINLQAAILMSLTEAK
ncbi:hypothetical protein NFI96_018307 [Prochilodus magdalenae]|nr:hypothetical protein NFI96_018307 [Prochilodus magdalenae]